MKKRTKYISGIHYRKMWLKFCRKNKALSYDKSYNYMVTHNEGSHPEEESFMV